MGVMLAMSVFNADSTYQTRRLVTVFLHTHKSYWLGVMLRILAMYLYWFLVIHFSL